MHYRVTNNKRLYSTFCTVKFNYWQTQSNARPLCESRATCFLSLATTIIVTFTGIVDRKRQWTELHLVLVCLSGQHPMPSCVVTNLRNIFSPPNRTLWQYSDRLWLPSLLEVECHHLERRLMILLDLLNKYAKENNTEYHRYGSTKERITLRHQMTLWYPDSSR